VGRDCFIVVFVPVAVIFFIRTVEENIGLVFVFPRIGCRFCEESKPFVFGKITGKKRKLTVVEVITSVRWVLRF
jgi:hypothetical protein